MKQPPSSPPPAAPAHAKPAPVDLSQESVAGEEDPGAALDLGIVEAIPAPTPAPRTTRRQRKPPERR